MIQLFPFKKGLSVLVLFCMTFFYSISSDAMFSKEEEKEGHSRAASLSQRGTKAASELDEEKHLSADASNLEKSSLIQRQIQRLSSFYL